MVKAKIVFHPSWWHKNFGIGFNEDFYFDYNTRIESEKVMKRGLYEKFGDIGLGEKMPKDEPIIGSYNIAAGWFLEAILGCNIIFSENESPVVVASNLSDGDINDLNIPDFTTNNNPYFVKLKKLMEKMEKNFGYIKGDMDLQGVLNISNQIRGQELFMDFYYKPKLINVLFDKVTDTIINAAKYFKARTGSNSVSASPVILEYDKSLFVTSNCTVDMISTDLYKKYLMNFDIILSEKLQPFGIHHCGRRSDEFSNIYSKIKGIAFYEAGWGGDIKITRKNFTHIFLSARLSPVNLLNQSDNELIKDIVYIVKKGGPIEKLIISCYGVDYNVPDKRIKLFYNVCNNIEDYL